MSTTVFAHFSQEIEKDKENFKTTTRERSSEHENWIETTYTFHGVRVEKNGHSEIGITLRCSGNHDLELQQAIEEKVAFYTIQASFPLAPIRRCGVYRLGAVEGDIRRGDYSHTFSGKSGDLKGLYELLRKIRAGKIYPVEDWEGSQVAKEDAPPPVTKAQSLDHGRGKKPRQPIGRRR